jgi:hypothetical protein
VLASGLSGHPRYAGYLPNITTALLRTSILALRTCTCHVLDLLKVAQDKLYPVPRQPAPKRYGMGTLVGRGGEAGPVSVPTVPPQLKR